MASRLGEILQYIGGAYLMAFGITYLLVVFSGYGLFPIPPDILLSISGLTLMLLFIAPLAAIAGIIGWYIDRTNRRATILFAIGSSLAFIPVVMNMIISGATIADAILSTIILAPLGTAFIISLYGVSKIRPAPHYLAFGEMPRRRTLRSLPYHAYTIHAIDNEARRRRVLREA